MVVFSKVIAQLRDDLADYIDGDTLAEKVENICRIQNAATDWTINEGCIQVTALSGSLRAVQGAGQAILTTFSIGEEVLRAGSYQPWNTEMDSTPCLKEAEKAHHAAVFGRFCLTLKDDVIKVLPLSSRLENLRLLKEHVLRERGTTFGFTFTKNRGALRVQCLSIQLAHLVENIVMRLMSENFSIQLVNLNIKGIKPEKKEMCSLEPQKTITDSFNCEGKAGESETEETKTGELMTNSGCKTEESMSGADASETDEKGDDILWVTCACPINERCPDGPVYVECDIHQATDPQMVYVKLDPDCLDSSDECLDEDDMLAGLFGDDSLIEDERQTDPRITRAESSEPLCKDSDITVPRGDAAVGEINNNEPQSDLPRHDIPRKHKATTERGAVKSLSVTEALNKPRPYPRGDERRPFSDTVSNTVRLATEGGVKNTARFEPLLPSPPITPESCTYLESVLMGTESSTPFGVRAGEDLPEVNQRHAESLHLSAPDVGRKARKKRAKKTEFVAAKAEASIDENCPKLSSELKKKRGRPKKVASADAKASIVKHYPRLSSESKKRRGRPKKKTNINHNTNSEAAEIRPTPLLDNLNDGPSHIKRCEKPSAGSSNYLSDLATDSPVNYDLLLQLSPASQESATAIPETFVKPPVEDETPDEAGYNPVPGKTDISEARENLETPETYESFLQALENLETRESHKSCFSKALANPEIPDPTESCLPRENLETQESPRSSLSGAHEHSETSDSSKSCFSEVAPEAETTVQPEAETAVAPEAEITVASEAETTVQPEAETTVAPEAETADLPEAETTVAPEAETTVAPEEETSVQPETETTVQPEAETTVASEAETTVTPEAETTDLLKAELTVAPEAETTVAPEAETTVQPEAETTVAPEAETTVQPEAETTVVPEAETAVAPEAETADLPEVHENNDTKDLPERETTGLHVERENPDAETSEGCLRWYPSTSVIPQPENHDVNEDCSQDNDKPNQPDLESVLRSIIEEVDAELTNESSDEESSINQTVVQQGGIQKKEKKQAEKRERYEADASDIESSHQAKHLKRPHADEGDAENLSQASLTSRVEKVKKKRAKKQKNEMLKGEGVFKGQTLSEKVKRKPSRPRQGKNTAQTIDGQGQVRVAFQQAKRMEQFPYLTAELLESSANKKCTDSQIDNSSKSGCAGPGINNSNYEDLNLPRTDIDGNNLNNPVAPQLTEASKTQNTRDEDPQMLPDSADPFLNDSVLPETLLSKMLSSVFPAPQAEVDQAVLHIPDSMTQDDASDFDNVWQFFNSEEPAVENDTSNEVLLTVDTLAIQDTSLQQQPSTCQQPPPPTSLQQQPSAVQQPPPTFQPQPLTAQLPPTSSLEQPPTTYQQQPTVSSLQQPLTTQQQMPTPFQQQLLTASQQPVLEQSPTEPIFDTDSLPFCPCVDWTATQGDLVYTYEECPIHSTDEKKQFFLVRNNTPAVTQVSMSALPMNLGESGETLAETVLLPTPPPIILPSSTHLDTVPMVTDKLPEISQADAGTLPQSAPALGDKVKKKRGRKKKCSVTAEVRTDEPRPGPRSELTAPPQITVPSKRQRTAETSHVLARPLVRFPHDDKTGEDPSSINAQLLREKDCGQHGYREAGKSYHCTKCGFASSSASSVSQHVLQEHDTPTLPCPVCKSVFICLETLNLHFIGQKGLARGAYDWERLKLFTSPFEGKNICGKCSFVTSIEPLIYHHVMFTHGDDNYQCDVCGLQIATLHRFSVHVKSHDKDSK